MPELSSRRPAVFVDRDGTIAEEVGYLNHASRFRIFPFVGEAIRRLNEAAWPVVVVTNQSGVGRGYFPESLVNEVNELMKRQLSKEGAIIDAVYYCPHKSTDNCGCANPKPECWSAQRWSMLLTCAVLMSSEIAMVTSNLHATLALEGSWFALGMEKASLRGMRQSGLPSRTSLRKIWRKQSIGY
jgi:histidinol-phosphate phosphatase family protein